MGDQRVEQAENAQNRDQNAEVRDQLQRLYAERGDAVERERDHLFQRVFRFAREALAAVVIDVVAPEADQRNDAAQEEVDLLVRGKALERASAHQPVVRVVEHDVDAEQPQELVVALGRRALEEGVLVALVAHAVDDVAALHVFLHEAVDGVDVVLQVGVHADRAVAQRHGGHQPGEQRVLVAAVVRELHAVHVGDRGAVLGNERPGLVAAAVVHVEDAALAVDLPGADHRVQLFGQPLGGFGQHGLLVVAGDHQIQHRCGSISRHL